MKKILLVLTLCTFRCAYGQITDDFSDGNFSANPAWTGSNNSADFAVNAQVLQSGLNTPNSSFYLSTPQPLAANAIWEFWCNLKFNPSGTNYVDVYLTADKADLQHASVNGYFVRIGNTDDEISLYKRSGPKSSAVKLIDGVNGILNTSNNTVKIKVTSTADHVFMLERDLSGTGTTYVSEGTATDNTFTASSHFGIFIQQSTASFVQKHFFDHISVRKLVADTTPPKLLSAAAIDTSTIEVLFDEAIDSTSGRIIANYQLNHDAGSPAEAKPTANPAKFTLHYTKGLKTADYTLTVNGMKDLEGNSIGQYNTAVFKYKKPFVAAKGDLVINEIFADPGPQVDLPGLEFIELLNTSAVTISLKNWAYKDPTTRYIFSGDSILPGEHLIICAKADTLDLKHFGRTAGISPWPSLNNSGDQLVLISPEGAVIDSVAYSDAWYRDKTKKTGGWTLERADPLSKCTGLFNWFASADTSGGTPGRQNSVYRSGYDQLRPVADSIRQANDTTLHIYFNKPVTTAGVGAFTLNPASATLKKVVFDTDLKQATLVYDHKFLPATTYQLLTGTDISDCAGNVIQPQTLSFTTNIPAPVTPTKPDTAHLLINEIFADPSPEVGLPLAEFVEIYNPGTAPADLSGWVLADPSSKATIKKGIIAPGSYLIVCPAADTALYQPFGKTVGVSPWPSLNNASDHIILKSFSGRVVDSVAYSDTWYRDKTKKTGGWTLERADPLSKCTGLFNWFASVDSTGGTPGRQNSVTTGKKPEPLKLLNAVIADSITINLTFSRPADSLLLASPANYSLNNGAGKPDAIASITTDFTSVRIRFAKPIARGFQYDLTVSNISDCSGTVMADEDAVATFTYPHQVKKGDILINEILFNPRPEGVDFVEIYNQADHPLDLGELTLASQKDTSLTAKAIFTGIKLIQPKEYVVLTTDPENIRKEYIVQSQDNFIKLKSMPSFNDDEGNVSLYCSKTLIDQFTYTAKMHFPLIKEPEGVSLERSSFKRPANNAGNFRSATAASGYATPGYKNSQYADDVTAEEEFSLASATVSPDNDGFEDALLIRYKFSKAGMVASFRIYNDKGMLIRSLAKNFTLDAEGTVSWDGLDDASRRPPTGIYMVYAEVFDTEGHVKQYKRTCAVAARLD